MSGSIFERLYDSEINFSVSCFWDDGFDVKLGEETIGYIAETSVRTWAEVELWLRSAALLYYPQSQFAMAARSS